MGIYSLVLRNRVRFTAGRALERSASVWQRCCAGEGGDEDMCSGLCERTAEPPVCSAFISHLDLVDVCVLVPGVSGKKRDPLLCFCFTSQSLGQFRAPDT